MLLVERVRLEHAERLLNRQLRVRTHQWDVLGKTKVVISAVGIHEWLSVGVGNRVPPLLMEVIANVLALVLQRSQPLTRPHLTNVLLSAEPRPTFGRSDRDTESFVQAQERIKWIVQ